MNPIRHYGNSAAAGWKRLSVWIKILIVLGVAALLYWFFHGSDAGNNQRQQAPIAIAPVTHKDVPVYLDGLGTVQAYNTVTIHSQVDGQLLEVNFREGQDVHKGDVLARIDPRTYKAQYDQAVANKAKDEALLANAKHDLERYQTIGAAVSGQTLDTQRATVHQLEATAKADQAAIDNAKATLSYTTITSPIDGRTGIRQVDAGNIVHAGDANGIVVVTQLQPISVLSSLPQQNLQAMTEQMNGDTKLQVLATGADNKTVLDTGALELIDNQIDQTTGTIKLKATFPNDKHQLWPGGFVNVRVLLTTRTNAVTIPSVAVQRGPNNGAYVFIYKPDAGTVEMRNVKVAMIADSNAVIDDGIQDGDQVVIDGMAKLQDGSKVTLAGAADKTKADDKKDGADGTEKKHHKHDKEGQ